MVKQQYLLGWGDPACVREVFLRWCKLDYSVDQTNGGYRFGEKCKTLEDRVRNLSEELLGVRHKYIVITNGAMQGLDAALSFFKNVPFEAYPGCSSAYIGKCHSVITRKFYFPHYPKIIKMNGLRQLKFPFAGGIDHGSAVDLNDNPSNPEAKIGDVSDYPYEKVIWDAVYNNPVYKSLYTPPIKHNVAIGSFGKLFGLPGLRIGWAATDDEKIANYVRNHVEVTTCGVSSASQIMIENILEKSSWLPLFFKEAKAAIDSNKTEFLKIKHLFDGQVPGEDGMFFFPEVGSKTLDMLSKAGVEFTPGEVCGDASGSRIRLNMAQTNDIVRLAVKAILRVDKT